MDAPPTQAAPPWAFWSPSPDEHIERALRLASVGPGTRFLDLGCGDGRVLVAAARLGAVARGIEIDPAVAEIARGNLAAAGVEGDVVVDDIYSAPLEADVTYAYLTPVTLSRLRRRFAELPQGARVVTPRYPIAGWQPASVDEGCYLYEAPVRPSLPGPTRGWPWRAAVNALPADRRVLLPLAFTAIGTSVELEVDPQLARAASHAVGECPAGEQGSVPIDLIFKPHGAGSVIAGAIRAQGVEATLAVVFADTLRGQWNFGPGQGAQFRETLDAVIASSRGAR